LILLEKGVGFKLGLEHYNMHNKLNNVLLIGHAEHEKPCSPI
jgi:hypothetical protein